MFQRTSAGTERRIEQGRAMVETLVRKPVKEAVHEALSEAQSEQGTIETTTGQSPGRSNRLMRPMLLLPLIGIAAAAFYYQRQKADTFETPQTEARTTGAATPAGSAPAQSGPGAGSNLRSDETAEAGDEETERDADEEATAS